MSLVRMGSRKAEMRLWRLSEAMLADPLLPTMPPSAMLEKLTRHPDDLGHGLDITMGQLRADLKKLKAIRLDVATAAADDLVGEEVMGITAQVAALWPAAMAGDPKANDSITRLRERKAALLGIDRAGKSGPAPTNVSLTVAYVDDWRPKVIAPPDADTIIEARAKQIEAPPDDDPAAPVGARL